MRLDDNELLVKYLKINNLTDVLGLSLRERVLLLRTDRRLTASGLLKRSL